jgi:hypothetical protein
LLFLVSLFSALYSICWQGRDREGWSEGQGTKSTRERKEGGRENVPFQFVVVVSEIFVAKREIQHHRQANFDVFFFFPLLPMPTTSADERRVEGKLLILIFVGISIFIHLGVRLCTQSRLISSKMCCKIHLPAAAGAGVCVLFRSFERKVCIF